VNEGGGGPKLEMAFHTIVCIKSVITRAPMGRTVRTMDSSELNPYDKPALETALRLREEYGGTVTALSMGPETCAFALHEAMAMGVDRSVLVCDISFAGADTLATSNTLAAAISKAAPFDLVLFGVRSADSDTGQVGPQTAVLLGLPLVTGARSVLRQGDVLQVERVADGFVENFAMSLPGALTIHPAAIRPRDVALGGIERAFGQQTVEEWRMQDLGLSSNSVGEAGSPTKVLSLSTAKKERKCEFLPGSPKQQAEALMRRLRELGWTG